MAYSPAREFEPGSGLSRPRDASGRFTSFKDLGVFGESMLGFIAASPVIEAAKLAKANEVAQYWKSIAPVRGDKDPHGQWGPTHDGGHLVGNPEDYRDSIKVRVDHHGQVQVGSDLMPLAEWLEYGSEHNPEHGYGARVLAHFGGGPVDAEQEITKNLYVG